MFTLTTVLFHQLYISSIFFFILIFAIYYSSAISQALTTSCLSKGWLSQWSHLLVWWNHPFSWFFRFGNKILLFPPHICRVLRVYLGYRHGSLTFNRREITLYLILIVLYHLHHLVGSNSFSVGIEFILLYHYCIIPNHHLSLSSSIFVYIFFLSKNYVAVFSGEYIVRTFTVAIFISLRWIFFAPLSVTLGRRTPVGD